MQKYIHPRYINFTVFGISMLLTITIVISIFVPVPSQLTDEYNGATVSYQISDMLYPTDEVCYSIVWDAPDVAAVYFDDKGNNKTDTKTYCGLKQPIDMRVVFNDQTEKVYSHTQITLPTTLLVQALIICCLILMRKWISNNTSLTNHLPKLNRFDALYFIVAIILILLTVIREWNFDIPYTQVTGDIQSNILHPLAVSQFSENFENDILLSDPSVYDLYQTALNWLVNNITYPLIQDPGLSILILAPFVLLTFHIGYYLLGLYLTGNRLITILFISLISPNYSFIVEQWGVAMDPLPRFMFQSLLPYLLLATLIWRNDPKRWMWLMIGSGLLVYVHAVSTPAWGFAIWLSLWLLHPKAWSILKRLRVMLFLGIIFIVTLLPFAINYIGSTRTNDIYDYSLIFQINLAHYDENIDGSDGANNLLETDDSLDTNGNIDRGGATDYNALGSFATFFTQSQPITATPVLLVLCLMLSVFITTQPTQVVFRMISAWVIGIILVSVGLPWIDQTIAYANNSFPLQIDLIRGLRYLVPLGFLSLIVFIAYIVTQLIRQSLSIHWISLLIAILIAIAIQKPVDTTIEWASENDLDWNNTQPTTIALFLDYLRDNTDNTTTILTTNFNGNEEELMIRNYAYRSLSWIRKDGNYFVYSDYNRLLPWFNLWTTLENIEHLDDRWERTNQLVQQISADYLAVELHGDVKQNQIGNAGFDLVYRAGNYALYEIVEPIPYDIVDLTEFANHYNYDERLTIVCDTDRINIIDEQNSNTRFVPYDTINELANTTTQFPQVISESDNLSLSLLTNTILRASVGQDIAFTFTLKRCRFN